MSRSLLIGFLLGGLTLGTIQATTGTHEPPADDEPLKVVVHINFSESGRQGHGLKNIVNILKDAPDTQIEVVCHGAGITLVERARTEHAETIADLIETGVTFVACQNTMRRNSISESDLLPHVGTVPSGAVEVIRKQQKEGYAYFKP